MPDLLKILDIKKVDHRAKKLEIVTENFQALVHFQVQIFDKRFHITENLNKVLNKTLDILILFIFRFGSLISIF